MYWPTPENSIMLSSFLRISELRIPSIAPCKSMFSRPVSFGLNPEPTSTNAANRPRTVISPFVGVVMLERILRMVVLPASLCPTIPRASPCSTWKLMSLSAHIGADRLLKGAQYERFGESPDVRSLYCFDTRSSLMSIMSSDDVGHCGFGRLEICVGDRKTSERDCGRERETGCVRSAAAE